MSKVDRKNERLFEIMLVLITVALSCVLYHTDGVKMVVLNLFYLPIVLAGFFLGRYRAGVLAFLSVIVASVVISLDITGFAMVSSPIVVALSVIMWGAVLGLTAIMVGTLCDDRSTKTVEAHEAYVGVVEVLSKYLGGANSKLECRAKRVSQLSEAVARKMRLSDKEVDDVRVAAMLIDIENIEVTSRVIRKAVGELENHQIEQSTFHGMELVQSLGQVLTGAFPLVLAQTSSSGGSKSELPFGARILRTVRAYICLADDPIAIADDPQNIIEELESDADADHHPAVLHALAEVVTGDTKPEWGARPPREGHETPESDEAHALTT